MSVNKGVSAAFTTLDGVSAASSAGEQIMSYEGQRFGLVKRGTGGRRSGFRQDGHLADLAENAVSATVRYFGTVGFVSDGGFAVDRDDDVGRVYIGAREAAKAGVALQAGDKIEFSIRPGGEGFDVMLCAYSDERHRV